MAPLSTPRTQGIPMNYEFDLGTFARPITTSSPGAQAWFDRGLAWTYGFNHEEAIACFQKAASEDPNCAMAFWGISYATGPNYNKPWEAFDAGRSRRGALVGTPGCVSSAGTRLGLHISGTRPDWRASAAIPVGRARGGHVPVE